MNDQLDADSLTEDIGLEEIVEQADRVATEVEELAEANQKRSATVTEVEKSVSRLTEAEAKADGGRPRASHDGGDGRASQDGPSSEGVSIPADVPDGMPEFVVDMLSEEQLRAVVRGELDPSDVMQSGGGDHR